MLAVMLSVSVIWSLRWLKLVALHKTCCVHTVFVSGISFNLMLDPWKSAFCPVLCRGVWSCKDSGGMSGAKAETEVFMHNLQTKYTYLTAPPLFIRSWLISKYKCLFPLTSLLPLYHAFLLLLFSALLYIQLAFCAVVALEQVPLRILC